MNQLQKRFVHVANWKMNKTATEASKFISTFLEEVQPTTQKVWFAVPFTDIAPVAKLLAAPYRVGAQNMNDASAGAYTGEIAAAMLQDAGASFVILGHSERRQYFHEDDAFVNRKVIKALKSSLQPILCIGESYEDREADKSYDVLEAQIQTGLHTVSPDDMKNIIIAYEPIWAIGTGKTATEEIIAETIRFIRTVVQKISNEQVANALTILYGGSVSEKTAKALSKIPDVNGFLIGTASLDPGTFAKIIALCDNGDEKTVKG